MFPPNAPAASSGGLGRAAPTMPQVDVVAGGGVPPFGPPVGQISGFVRLGKTMQTTKRDLRSYSVRTQKVPVGINRAG